MASNIKACLVPKEDNKPCNRGAKYCYDHKDKWVDLSSFRETLTVGFVKGIDCIKYRDKVYMIWKAFVDPEENAYVLLCLESQDGCDILVEPETETTESEDEEETP